MATSKMKIKKVCEWCGTTFYAQKLTTRFCSHRCNNLSLSIFLQSLSTPMNSVFQTARSHNVAYTILYTACLLSPNKVATLLGLSKQAVYKMVYATL